VRALRALAILTPLVGMGVVGSERGKQISRLDTAAQRHEHLVFDVRR
jgi:hypothetical protein